MFSIQAIFLQLASSGRLDLISFLLGTILTLLVVLAIYRYGSDVLARLRQFTEQVKDFWQQPPPEVNLDLQAALAAPVRQHHLGDPSVSLEQIFVRPRILDPELDVDINKPLDLGTSHLNFLWPQLASGVAIAPAPSVSLLQLLRRGRRVLISGAHGSGKTTLLAYCAHLCAHSTHDQSLQFLSPYLTIFTHLAELDLAREESSNEEIGVEPDPLAPLDGLLRARLPGNRKIDRLLRTKAAEGKLLLLIDGWDESPSGSRGQATAWLQAVLDDYAEIKVIMAGPQEDYGPLMELDFVVTGLLPWRVGQVERLGRSWAEALNLDTHQPTHSFWQPGQSILETSLRLRLALNGHNDDTSQPTGRQVDLMEMALRQLLPLETNLDEVSWLAPAARELWQELAYCQMVEGVASQSQSEILTLIDTIVAEYDAEGDRRAARKLFDSLRACGLFVFYSNEQVGFLSPVWRDFLAACHLAQQRHGQEVIGRAADRHWAGVLRFYVARCGAADLARSLLENENGAKEELFFQLASWLSEATDEGEWRRQTMVGLGRLIVDANAPTAIRQRATLALALTGEDGVVAFLRQLLQQPDPNMRQVALACLARVAPEIAVGLLEQMSGDSEASIRYTAVHALAWMDEPAAEQPILEALIEPDEAMYQAAAEGIALNSTEDSFEILREASTEMALTIRRAAVHGLTLVDEPWAAELLGKMAKEDDQWVIQTSAAAALENSGLWSDAAAWQAPQPGDQGWLISWAIAQGRAVPVGPAAMSVLLDALRDRDAAVQMAATITLGQMAARVSTKRLRALMTDSPNALREAAYVALCRIKRAWGDQMYSG